MPKRRNEEGVRQETLRQLRTLGWRESQVQWKPEWRVPDTPHDLTKRERGQKYATCGSCDLVLFDDDSVAWHALRVIFELKAPGIKAGRAQLIRYLSNDPMAKMGFWTNGTETLAIYKTADGRWVEDQNAALPRPGDDLTQPPTAPLTWSSMERYFTTLATERSALQRHLDCEDAHHFFISGA